MLVQKVKLGDLLLERGLVSQEEFDSCLEEAKESGIRVGQVLIDRGYLSEDQVFRVLSEQQGFEYIDLAGIDTDSKIAAKVGGQTLKKHGAFPIREDELNIVFTFKDPLDLTAQDAIQRLFPKKILKVVGSNPVLLEKYIRQYEINESIRDLTAEIRKEIAQSTAGDGSEASSILKLINIIVESAIYARGSDIHIEPTEKNCIVRTRIDGILKESFSFDADIYPPLASRIK
ncbi:MAG TPA: general secretion pathway protein GspE, partial [Campylobacterales bacterium]|nr:general secretion pathway protein GspE [Campylobacterales bacterium]